MKKLNLIERLLSYSHEKQKKRGVQKYCILLLLLFTCVTHAWGATTVYYVNRNNWGTVKIHTWNSTETKWPGNAMTNTGATKDGYAIYSYSSGDFGNCIFNCGSNSCQTSDLTVQNGKMYYNGSWVAYSDDSTPSTYTVEYDGNGKTGGSVPTDANNYSSGATVTVKGNTGSLVKTGCVFDGWMTAQDGSGTTYAPGATFSISANTTLYARWIAKTIYVYDNRSWKSMNLYTFSDKKNGSWPGSGGVTSLGSSWYQIDILDGASNFILNGGGAQTVDLTTNNYTAGHSYETYDDSGIKLREKTFTVSFNMKSHGSAVSSQNIYYNGLVTEPSPAPSATGYDFGGWYKENGCTNAWNFGSDRITAARTLYAKWTAKNYTVPLNANDASATDGSATVYFDGTSMTIGTEPTLTGYHVAGYYKQAEKTNLVADAAGSFGSRTVTGIITSGAWKCSTNNTPLYTEWEANTYYVSYNANGGSGSMSNSSHTYGTASNLSTCTLTPPSGYTFAGWATAADGAVVYADGASVSTLTATDGGTYPLFAKWEELSGGTVTLTAGTGGEVSLDNSNWSSSKTKSGITTNTSFNIYAQASTGYSFSAWAKSSGQGTITSTGSASTSFTPVANQDAELTASFTENMSDLSVNRTIDEGSPSIAAPTVTGSYTNIGYVTTRTITAAAAATGYALTGWTITNGTRTDGGGATANPITVRSNGNASETVTVTANYSIQSYTISSTNTNVTYSPESGTSFKFGSTGDKMTITPKSGYKITAINTGNVALTASADNNATGSWTVTGTMPGTNVTLDITAASVPEIRLLGRFKIYNSTRTSYSTISGNDWETTYGNSTMKMTYNYITGYYDLATYRSATELTNDGNLYFYPSSSSTRYGTYNNDNLDLGSSVPVIENVDNNGGGGNFHFNSNAALINVVLHFDKDNYKFWFTGDVETLYSTTFYAGEHGSINANGTSIAKDGNDDVNIGFCRTLTASPESGFTFDRWVTTGSVSVADATSASTTVTATGAGGTVTAQWNVNSGWYLSGDGFGGFGTDKRDCPFNKSYRNMSGMYYREVTLTSGDRYFKVHDGSNEQGPASDGTVVSKNGAAVSYRDQKYGAFKCNISGTVWFVINTNNNELFIQDPQVYQTLTYDIGDVKGGDGTISSSPNTASGSTVIQGNTVTLTAPNEATGYAWAGWYPNSDGSGVQQCSTKAYAITMDDDVETYACYTENYYSVTIQNDGHGTTTPSSSFDVYYHTGESITANPSDYYAFDYWTISGGGLSFKSPKTANDKTTTVTATSTGGIIKAYFKLQWTIAGGDGDDEKIDDMGNWNTGANEMTYVSGTSVSKTITINTPGEYYLKVKDRREDNEHGWYGKNSATITRGGASVSGLTTGGGNITFTADVAGTYVFTFDASAKSLSVSYPATITWSANSIYSGSATIAASVTNVTSGNSLKYELFNGTDMSVSAAQTYNTTTTSTSDSHNFTVTPSFGASEVNKVYTVKITYNGQYSYYTHVVGRKWDIYVHDVQSWGGVKEHHWGDYGSSSYPGDACAGYNTPSNWYTVTIDGKYNTGFVLSKSSDQNTKTVDLPPSITTYPSESYWYINYADSKYTLASAGTVVAPTVTLTVDKINVNQITVTGTLTSCGGDGTTAADMKEVGFKVGGTTYVATYTSGTSFKKTITGLDDDTDYSVKAYATNIVGTGESAAQNITTLEDADYLVKVRVDHGETAPKVYAWTAGDAYGGGDMENGTYKSQGAATLLFEASEYDWYYCELNNKYENFLIYTTGDGDKSGDFAATRVTDCYWYDADGTPSRAAQMDCPVMTTNLYFGDKDAAAGDHVYHEMSGITTAMTKTLSLAAGQHYEFKIVYNTEFYGASATVNRDGKTNNVVSAGTVAVNGAYIYLNTDFAGDYTFTFNESTKAVTVKYPDAYVMTYSYSIVGTDNSTTGAPSAETSEDVAVSSGDLVLDDATLTFTAAAAATGYTWKGWYTVADPSADYSANKVSVGSALTYTPTVDGAAITVYAVYAEDMHTVTVTVSDHGRITTPESPATTVQAGIATGATITAEKDFGYFFSRWTLESGNATFANYQSASTTVYATADATVKANFVSHWSIAGGDSESVDGEDAMGNWDLYLNGIENFTEIETGVWQGWVEIDLPANTTFWFKVRDLDDVSAWYGNTGEMTYGNHTNWTMTQGAANCRITTAGKGTYRFTWNETYKQLTVTYPTSWTVSYGVRTSYNGGATSDATTTGGSITSVVDGDDIALTSGKYVVGGGSVAVVAAPEDGYEIAGWYSDAACTSAYTSGEGNVTISGEGNTNFSITSLAANTGIYVKFAEKMTTVNFASEHGHVEISSVTETSANVGVHTKYTLTPVADWGYYFAGWEKTTGTEYAITGTVDNEDNTAPELSGNGNTVISGQTLTAKFAALEKVYLYNYGWGEPAGALWTNDETHHVYAYFAVQEDYGHPKSANTDDPYYIQQMAQAESNTLYAYVPRAVTRNLSDGNDGNNGDNQRIAFSNHQFAKNWKFNSDEAIYWGSYRQIINEFIPKVNHYETVNYTKMYKGYWKRHDAKIGDEAGYYLKHRTGTNTYSDFTNGTQATFKYISENQIQCKLRIDNPDDDNNLYMIHSAGGVKYTTAVNEVETTQVALAPTITTSNRLNVGVTENQLNDSRFLVKQTSEGYYMLTMTFSTDTMYLTVDYPISVGDYRLEHSYTVEAVTKKTYSGTIKHDASGKAVIASMYLNMDAGTKTLKMQTCTSINGSGHPVWSSGTTVSNFTTSYFDKGKGVYAFQISWNDDGKSAGQDVNSATPDDIDLYEGEYYIKTNYATGGWTNWSLNNMEKNTINYRKENPKTFDYYYAAWVDDETGDRNVKCVIANDYNEALCDTLVNDDIANEYLTYDASVRFSYNSYTNDLKRAYINGSSDGTTDYIYLQGTSGANSRILDNTGAAFVNNKVKFSDRGNWIYEIDLKAEEGARVKLISDYYHSSTHHYQYLKGSKGDWADATTSLILGGENNTTSHPIRIVYDFKTNHLISAWLAEDEISTRAINTNAMIIRDHQEQASQITFASGSDKLTDVDTIYSVMKFNKWTINNKSRENTGTKENPIHENLASPKSQYERDLFWISFPYDVRLSDVFGFGEYMKHWAIQYYDGRGRAKNGFWAESKPNWKFIPASKKDTILHAFEGYVLALDLDELGLSSKVWELVEDVYLYFPSNGPAGTIVQQDTVVDIDTTGYHCNINRTVQSDGVTPTGLPESYDRRYRDSHWHCIGVPSYHDVSHGIVQNIGEGTQPWADSDSDGNVDMPNPAKYETISDWETVNIPYFYEWNMTDNQLYPKSNAANYTFKAMYAYMVQYANPEITWSAVAISPKPKSVVERRKARMADDHFNEFNLHLMRDDQTMDYTYVRLTDNESATAAFEFGQDMCKELQGGVGIYTLIDKLEVAGNSLPLNPEGTTIVPVGVTIKSNGLYSFSMPEGTNGVGVVLVDDIAGTRTNLALMDYEVSLTAGKIDNRFWLEISPIAHTPTGIENAGAGSQDAVRKVVVDGVMYILKEGVVYDAQGKRVK